eukprot:SAG11_NODE_1112_length_5821_cov_43.477281_5_plen_62_part_00
MLANFQHVCSTSCPFSDVFLIRRLVQLQAAINQMLDAMIDDDGDSASEIDEGEVCLSVSIF